MKDIIWGGDTTLARILPAPTYYTKCPAFYVYNTSRLHGIFSTVRFFKNYFLGIWQATKHDWTYIKVSYSTVKLTASPLNLQTPKLCERRG
jgi:hypothetical protein